MYFYTSRNVAYKHLSMKEHKLHRKALVAPPSFAQVYKYGVQVWRTSIQIRKYKYKYKNKYESRTGVNDLGKP